MEYVILKCDNCNKSIMCLEDDVSIIEEERSCCHKASYSIVPKEEWDVSDWIQCLICTMEDMNRHDDIDDVVSSIRVLPSAKQIEAVKKYLKKYT